MSVYVDDMYLHPMGRFGRMKMSHMTADTHKELVAMASLIGLSVAHIQYKGTWKEHFDVSMTKRALAIKNGAIEVGMRQGTIAAKERFKK